MKTAFVLLLPLVVGTARAQDTLPTPSTMKTPAETTLPVVVVREVKRRHLAPKDRVYLQTVASVVRHGRVLIPAGTELEGEVVSVVQPSFLHRHAELTVHFPEAILSTDYILPLDDELSGQNETVKLTLNATIGDDVLLESGTPFELPLRTQVSVDLARLPMTPHGPGPIAAPCRRYSGSSGTPDTVIPGSPGTPDTTIPGINGAPPTIIPGTPPGQPTVIPGSPATAGGCSTSPRIAAVELVP